MRAVAAHDVAGVQFLDPAVGVREDGFHLVRACLHRAELGRPLHLRAEARKVLGEQPLGRALRQSGEGVGDLGRQTELDAGAWLAVDVDQLAPVGHRLVQHFMDQAHGVPHLQGAGHDADGLGMWLWVGQLIDDAAVHAVPPQFGRHRQAHWARAHHEYVDIGHDQAPSSSGLVPEPVA